MPCGESGCRLVQASSALRGVGVKAAVGIKCLEGRRGEGYCRHDLPWRRSGANRPRGPSSDLDDFDTIEERIKIL